MLKYKIRVTAALMSLVIVLCLCGCGGPVELDVPTFEDNQSVVIGTWTGSMSNYTTEQFTYLQDASINMLVGISSSVQISQSFLDKAQNAGIQVLPDSRSWNGEVPEYIDHPAFAGYCVWDEPAHTDFEVVAEKKTLWDSCMQDKMFFVNLFPGYWMQGGPLGGTFEYYISTYVETVDPELVCFDHYALVKNTNGDTVVRDTFFHEMDICSHYAKEAGIPFWFTLLTSGHLDYPVPDTAELRWQMAVAQAYGATGLVHYVYASHESDYTCPIDWSTQAPTDLYESMAKANAEIAAWDHIYRNYQWQKTANIPGTNNEYPSTLFQMCKFDADPAEISGITAIESTEEVLCGVFTDENGNMAYMLTNATNPAEKKDAAVKLTLDGQYQGILVIDRGEQTTIQLEKNVATIEIDSSEGVFVIPLKAKS